MRTTTLCSGCFAAALMFGGFGCDTGVEDDESDFRGDADDGPTGKADGGDDDDGDSDDGQGSGVVEFWNFGLGNPANGDTTMAAGDNISPFDLIWDIDEGTTSQSATTDNGTVVTAVIRETVDDEILDGEGNVLCTAVQSQSGVRNVYQLLDSNGDAVLTLWHRYVFAGDVQVPKAGWKVWKLISKNTLYSFKKKRVFEDRWWQGESVATADVKIASANPMRKLELAALLAGECGAGI